jgi:uncharacterized protein YjbI with pentapeptide repeats
MQTRLFLGTICAAIAGAMLLLGLAYDRQRKVIRQVKVELARPSEWKQLQLDLDFDGALEELGKGAGPELKANDIPAGKNVEKQENPPVAPAPTDRESVVAELQRMGAALETAQEKADGPIVRVCASGDEVNNRTLALIGALADLECLELYSAAITDPGMAELGSLQKLRKLKISISSRPESGKITDKSLAVIASMAHLEYLSLSNVSMTDAGLESSLPHLGSLQTLVVTRTHLGSRWLRALKNCEQLSILALAKIPAGDAGLAALEDIPHLTSLGLRDTDLSPEGIVAVGKLTNLRQLDLSHTNLNDAGLQQLSALTKLEELNVAQTQITGSGLAGLKDMTLLRELNLAGTQVGDAGMEHLGAVTSLEHMSLHGTLVGDAGLVSLLPLSKLRELDVAATRVTDTGLPSLSRIDSLQVVDLGGTKVSAGKILELQQKRPLLRVVKSY